MNYALVNITNITRHSLVIILLEVIALILAKILQPVVSLILATIHRISVM